MAWIARSDAWAAAGRASPLAALGEEIAAEQERWFLWVPVFFGVGIASYFALGVEPSALLAAGLAVIAVTISLLWRESMAALVSTSAVLALCLGFCGAKLRSNWVAAPVIGAIANSNTYTTNSSNALTVTGWVELVEPRPKRGQRLTLRLAEVTGLAPGNTPARIRVRLLQADPELKPGQTVRLKVQLSAPAGPALPGGFDFSRAAWFQSLGAVGYAREAVERVEIARPMPQDLAWRAPIERLRQAIGQRVMAALPGETGAIAAALITGERGGISDATNDAYRDSGLFHILSISGLHMVIMAGAVFVSVRFLLTLSPALALRFPVKKWAAAAAALGALGYLLISGASFPTVRSYIMISIMFLAVLLDRPAVALRNVALSALLILVLFPESLIDVGFQMSFAAVTALVAVYEVIRERERRQAAQRGSDRSLIWKALLFFGGILLSTLIAGLAVAPFAAFHFHKSQQFAMIANLIAIPICNILVMPAALAALVVMPMGLESWPLKAMGAGIEAMTWCAYAVAALPGAVGRIPEIPTLAFGLMVVGGLWICLWRRRWRYAGLLAILAGLLVAPFRAAPDVYVGRDGLVAVRGADGRLQALSPKGASFDLARILEHDGDGRRLDQVAAAQGFRCDWSGCVTSAKGVKIAIPRHPAALADDCAEATVVIMPALARPGGDVVRCAAEPLIDATSLRRFGAHTLRFQSVGAGQTPTAKPVVSHVAAMRGARPWTREETPATFNRAGSAPRAAASPSSPPLPGRGPSPEPASKSESLEPRSGPQPNPPAETRPEPDDEP